MALGSKLATGAGRSTRNEPALTGKYQRTAFASPATSSDSELLCGKNTTTADAQSREEAIAKCKRERAVEW